jgi:uncharacterized protein YidB (DUF937 family)
VSLRPNRPYAKGVHPAHHGAGHTYGTLGFDYRRPHGQRRRRIAPTGRINIAAQRRPADQGFDANSLGTLVNSFQQAGLGHLVESWIGNGPNQSVSPQQLHSVLGDNQVQQMSAQSGMAPQDFLSQLSQHLPNVVNSMTPHGQLPDEGSMSV